jgi:hypothetical protein
MRATIRDLAENNQFFPQTAELGLVEFSHGATEGTEMDHIQILSDLRGSV